MVDAVLKRLPNGDNDARKVLRGKQLTNLRQQILPAQGGEGVLVPAQFSVPYSGWFFLGAGISGASLLGGVLLGRPMGRGRPLLNGALAGCIFMVMITPAFAVVCVPFTLGLFLTLAAGLALGSLSGGILGFWTLRRMRAFR